MLRTNPSAREDSSADWSQQDDVFRLLVDSVQDYAIFVLDPRGHVVTWNTGAKRIKGYTADEIIGRHFSVFYPQPDVAAGLPATALAEAARTGHWEHQGWRVRKDGSQFWASVFITALRDNDGRLVGFAKVTRDLTVHREAEQQREDLLRLEQCAREEADRSIEQLRSIQSLTEAALGHLDLEGLLDDLVGRIADILSVDTVAVLLLEGEARLGGPPYLVTRAARGIEEEVEQGVRIPLGQGFAGTIAATKTPRSLTRVGPHNVMNSILWEKGILAMLGVPLLVEGSVIGVLHVGSLTPRTFTEQETRFLQIVGDRVGLAIEHARLIEVARSANEEARAAEDQVRVRDAFLSVAAHELRTPITSLRLAAQLLQSQLRSSDFKSTALEASLSAVDRQSEQLSRLIGRLLDRVRLQHAEMELEKAATDIGVLVAQVLERARQMNNRHEILLHVEGSTTGFVDAIRLEQVFTNLVDNAIKFSPDGGPIRVSLSALRPGIATITVEDRGIGVPMERRERLFERFYQAHSEDHRSGMGLGLYISKEIVEAHGGSIRADFPPEGGTRVLVELPLDIDAADEMAMGDGDQVSING